MESYTRRLRIGDTLVVCEADADAVVLAPVIDIVAGDSGDQYTLQQLELMVTTLQRYDRRTGRIRQLE